MMRKEIELPAFFDLENPDIKEAAGVLSSLAEVFLPQLASPSPRLRERSNVDVPTAEAKYRTLLEQIPAVVFMAFLDRGLGEAYVSPQIERMLGFTQDEWLGDPVRWYRQIHSDDKARWSIDAAQLLLTGEPLRSVYKVLARDGSVVWFQCEAKMVRKAGGEPWFIHGVGFDVSDLKRAEEIIRQAREELEKRVEQRTLELKQANLELARSNAELEQFAYVASHDLQEPLRSISSFTDLLAKRYQGKLDSKADNYIHFILEGNRQMQALISDLLTYSRAGSRKKPFKRVQMDVVLDRALLNLSVAISENKAVISRDSLPSVLGDEVQLVELLQNLIANAIKFHGPKSAQIHVTGKAVGAECVFSVQDNGIGIDPRHAERIFVIFQRLHTHEEYAGTGIGLAVCKKIVEGHGGRIWVESRVGQGSTFFFTIPHWTGAQSASPVERA